MTPFVILSEVEGSVQLVAVALRPTMRKEDTTAFHRRWDSDGYLKGSIDIKGASLLSHNLQPDFLCKAILR